MNQKNFKYFDICKFIEASWLCPQCFCYYCEGCFKQVHSIKENSEHKKEAIDYNVPIDTRCPDHSGNNINLFCLDEKGNIYINI